ncbi:MAG: restriction endonuclease subunit S [Sulfurimonas sp.]
MLTDLSMNDLIVKLRFMPKENSINIYHKKYTNHNGYNIEIDLEKNSIDFGSAIFFNDSKNSAQKITKEEDLVVLECVDRLLTKGYSPKNIILEKIYPSGHGTSGRLDILVTRDNGTAYMMIECKTWGKEFDKAFAKLNKDGGQLFTYFQQDKDAAILVLYTSALINKNVEYKNEIIKIEDEYKVTSNVKDFYDRWNKTTKNNGVFNDWNTPYNYKSQALTPKDLVDIKQEDSSFIFNRFMEILRHNVVSDKPNAFNKIFTLFLCKIMDEKHTKPNEELEFQWLEGIDDHVTFQKRLTDLYQRGMKEFLDKEVTDLSDKEFEEKFGVLDSSIKDQLLKEFTKIRLQKNNEFAIKDVFDQETFDENAIVVKEIVELLQNYKIRYTKKQQFLSDFFELLLTTGLKQEVGQFFTPVPIARFIIRSIPFDRIIKEKLLKGERDELLPNVIDYAVGSGHFITEAMDEIQKELNHIATDDFIDDTAKKIKSWKTDHFDWAYDYVYGIEKDYRLVKTAKVGCYLHGDGLAKVIHGDGLSNFTNTKEFKGKLAHSDKNYPQDNKKFDIVVSNPPYSVSAFKNVSKKFDSNDFELYDRLTDQSSEIEALFIERTKQLLKDGGIAGIILPNSILTGGGIYTKTREIVFKYFDIICIAELGSNTFMATGTNTVVLFLRRKNNMEHVNIQSSIEKLFDSKKDITINGLEKPLSKYLSYVWENITIDDYITLVEKNANATIQNHENYKEYTKKFDDAKKIIEIEKEKLLYFILAYNQKVTVVKTGDKQAEKKFLGYEFSNRRGSEGIHAIARSKSIDECTSLYDENSYVNFLKANSYIYSAFNGDKKEIDDSLKENIFYMDLVDMMSFDRAGFEKNISLNAKKKFNIESKWEQKPFSDILEIEYGTRIVKKNTDGSLYPVYGGGGETFSSDEFNRENRVVISRFGMSPYCVRQINGKFFLNDSGFTVSSKDENILQSKYLDSYLFAIQEYIYLCGRGVAQKNMDMEEFKKIKIPLPPKDIQEKIVKEIEDLERTEEKNRIEIEKQKNKIDEALSSSSGTNKALGEICEMKAGTFVSASDISDEKTLNTYLCYGGNGLRGFTKTFTHEGTYSLVGRQGALCGNVHKVSGKFYATEHALVVTPYDDIDNNWLDYKLKEMNLNQYATGSAQPGLSVKNLIKIAVLVPSIEDQKKIVAQIETIEKEIQKKEQELANIPKQKQIILDKYLK